jgi:NAD(P)-dependent dehydrogenase (short-subunit alcohol dehydrogenase family)
MKKVALITGAAGGIGAATVQAFAATGWSVIGVDREKAALPGGARCIQTDVADPAALAGVFDDIGAAEGRLDALVNNAAVQICRPLVATSPEEWDRVMDTNVGAVYHAVRLAHPLLKKAGGAIVNVSSVHAVATSADIAAYAASKGAVLSLTRALAIELAPDGIRVNAVLPGAVDTPMLRAGLSRGHLGGKDALAALAGRTVIGRVGQPGEIAQAILFLADDGRSSFITGQPLVVDGGATARLSTE